jgi:hypothetical protein
VKGSVMLAGFDGPSQTLAPNSAAAYVPLQVFEERKKLGVSLQRSWPKRARHRRHQRGDAADRPAAAHPGHRLGRRLSHDDRGSRRHGYEELGKVAYGLIGQANQTKGLQQIYTFFDVHPAHLRRYRPAKADLLGVPPERVFEALRSISARPS